MFQLYNQQPIYVNTIMRRLIIAYCFIGIKTFIAILAFLFSTLVATQACLWESGILQKTRKGTGGCAPDWRMSSSILLMLRHTVFDCIGRSSGPSSKCPAFCRSHDSDGTCPVWAKCPCLFQFLQFQTDITPNRVAALASSRKFPKALPTDGRVDH